MQKISVLTRNRGVRLVALLVVVGGTLGLMAPVDSAHSAICAFRPTIRTYYSDASHTTVVGQRGIDCSCNDASWGVTSAFVTSQQLCCSVNTC
jgi:hypothetical protein